jgi:multidrug transporter EmrE-like cation transporter
MRDWALGFLLLAIVDTVAHLCFKLAAIRAAPFAVDLPWVLRAASQPWLYGAMSSYVVAFFIWIRLLQAAPVGTAFAVSHIDVVTVLIASSVFLQEPISGYQMSGATLILCGVGCLAVAQTE